MPTRPDGGREHKTATPPTTNHDTEQTPALPFSDVEAEAYLLAAVMWSNDAYTIASRLVNAAAFWRPAHAAIFAAVAHLRSRDLPCDPVTVSDRMRQTQEHIEHIRVVPRVFDRPWAPASVIYHARLVARAAVRRHTHDAAVRAAQSTTLADHDAFRAELDRAINRLTALATAWDTAGGGLT